MVGVVLASLLAGGTGWAQAVAGSQISGIVRDTSGGAIPGAEVTVAKTDTGLIRTVFTGSDGSYVLTNLPVGPYQLKVVLQGFNTYVRDGIVLQVSTNPEINVTLSVGAISEQVTVVANSSLVEAHSSGVGQVIDNQRVLEMPLNGRQAAGRGNPGLGGGAQQGRRTGNRQPARLGDAAERATAQRADLPLRSRDRRSRWRP